MDKNKIIYYLKYYFKIKVLFINHSLGEFDVLFKSIVNV